MTKTDKFLDPIVRRYVGITGPESFDVDAQLLHIAEVSRSARTTWLGLLGLLAFVGITLLSHEDADFFAQNAATQLPLINITVPVEAFFLTAPVLVAAIYAYFHLYLITLWQGLAEAPPMINGRPLTSRVFPWLISYAALWYRNRRREDGSAGGRTLGALVVVVSIFLSWLFGLLVIGGLWIRSMPVHNEWLTFWIGGWFWFALMIGLIGFLTARALMAGASSEAVATSNLHCRTFGFGLLLILGLLSWETTEGGLIPHAEDALPPILVSANLSEAELTPRPGDWKPFELWLRDRRQANDGDADQEPLVPTSEEMQRWGLLIASLDSPDLSSRDLRGANFLGAFLPGSNLRGAQLDMAVLAFSKLQGSKLEGARMRGSILANSALQGANMNGAELRDAFLADAEMQAVDLSNAQLQGAVLADAKLQAARLYDANMQGADLRNANLQESNLFNAKLQGTDLRFVNLSNANTAGAQFQGALLVDADAQNISCANSTNFLATSLHGTNVSCRMKTGLVDGLGNEATVLPAGIRVRSCFPRDTERLQEIETAIAFHPESARFKRSTQSDLRDFIFCGDNVQPKWVGRDGALSEESTAVDYSCLISNCE